MNAIIAAYHAAVAVGDPYADPESWLAMLSDMSAGSTAWEWYQTPELVEAEEYLEART